jgi:hypothetical protein
MTPLFISGRTALADASELIDSFGDAAEGHAAERAEISRDSGNVRMFCHWRQIERLIVALCADHASGTVH